MADPAEERASFDADALLALAGAALKKLVARDDVRFCLHVLLLTATLTLARPLFAAPVAVQSYEAKSVFFDLLFKDFEILANAARRQHPAAPRLLFLVVPTIAILLAGARVRWTHFDAGKSLRILIFVCLFVLAWTGSCFDYNLYLDRGHAFDRLLLVGLVALAWRTPLAVPFATAWSYVMLKEAYVPIALDDFDFRSVFDVLVVFSCFVWLAPFKKTYQTKHFLWVALGAWASYYFWAGVAKITFGPKGSWLFENHLSNLIASGYVRGWLQFLPERFVVGFADLVEKGDVALSIFTIVVELGSLVAFHAHPKLMRTWAALAALLNFGIFLFSGICFWKWIATNVALYFFASRGGAGVVKDMCRHKLAVVLAVVAIWFSNDRVYFYPQTHVVWYDSKFIENYTIVAVGAESGERYLVDPSTLTPMEMHWVQGRLCYATDEKGLTGIYGATGSYGTTQALERAKAADEGFKMLAKGHPCKDAEKQKTFDEFMQRYFRNMNHRGRPWRWLHVIKGPTHLWVQPQGNLYKLQEPVAKIELWRQAVFHYGGALQRSEKKMVHEVAIPK